MNRLTENVPISIAINVKDAELKLRLGSGVNHNQQP